MADKSGSIDRRRLVGAALAGTAVAGPALAASPKAALKWLRGHGPAPRHAGGGAAAPVVETADGKLRGAAGDGFQAFKGIPYGAPTGGENRWRPPQPVKRWGGVREATAFGHISPQPLMPVIPEETDSQAHEAQGEDCLLLSVWTPEASHQGRRPVMVWFHGGGYAVGGGSAPWYHGARLAARHDVVVVTVNHRLNAFGYLYLAELSPAFADSANVGMLDCSAALKWVNANIAAFGGDPQNVTIFGESGGAGKVSTLMAMPSAAGLFHRAAAQSGAALRANTPEQGTRTARALLDALGVAPADAARLRSVATADIVAAVGKAGVGFGLGPVVDGQALPHHPFDPAAPAISAEVPFLTGSNLTESTFFPDTPLDPLDDADLAERVKRYTRTDDAEAGQLIALYRDQHPTKDNVFLYQLISSEYWMRTGVLLQAERKAALGRAPAYVYQFNRLSPARGGKLHCPHGSEIPYVFDNVDSAKDLTGDHPSRQAVADRMSAAWTAFARYGDPNTRDGRLPYWPAYGEGRAVMVFDNESSLELDPGGRERAAVAAVKARQAGV